MTTACLTFLYLSLGADVPPDFVPVRLDKVYFDAARSEVVVEGELPTPGWDVRLVPQPDERAEDGVLRRNFVVVARPPAEPVAVQVTQPYRVRREVLHPAVLCVRGRNQSVEIRLTPR